MIAWKQRAARAILSVVSRRRLEIGIVVAVTVVGSARAAPLAVPSGAPSTRELFPRAPVVAAPRIRVGLSSSADGTVQLGTTGGALAIWLPGVDQPFWPDRADGIVTVVPEGGLPQASTPVRRIQIGAFRTRDKAQDLADRLAAEFHVETTASWDSSRNVWRIRIGAAETNEALYDLLTRVRDGGFPDAWIVSEPRQVRVGGTLRLVDRRWDVRSTGAERLLAVAPPGEALTVGGKAYRGLVEVRLSPYGAVQAINELPLEEYLRAVVPLELGPGIFPELDAQKAQAIAARTYAIANLGQFTDEGFDICDTPRCQVYGGRSAEHPLSDRAIRETAGQVLAFEGAPINALFTATCGGHTEDVANVFPEWRGGYLRGVPCVAEDSALAAQVTRVRGDDLPAALSELPAQGKEALWRAVLIASGVLPRQADEGSWRAAPLTAAEAESWGTSLARRAGRGVPSAIGEPFTRVELWRWLGAWTGATDGAAQALLPGDERFLVMSGDRVDLAAADWPVVAELLDRGLPLTDETGRLRPSATPTRAEYLALLGKLAEIYDVSPLWEGTVLAPAAGRLRLRRNREEVTLALKDSSPLLLAETNAGWWRVDELELLPGDKVVGLEQGSRLVLLGVKRRLGRGDDRRGTNYRWTEVREGPALEESLGKVAPVGKLRGLEIVGRGVSGRVAQLKVVGSTGAATIEGFRVRRALDLPELLFSMQIQRSDDGTIRRVIFRGRGWGHGVGLCQSGAYGMALRGVGFEQILGHYYPGAQLVDWSRP